MADTKQIIIPKPDLAEATDHTKIPAAEPVDVAYHLFNVIPPRISESLKEQQILNRLGELNVVVRKHKWRWKKVAEKGNKAEKGLQQADADNSPKLGSEVLLFIAFGRPALEEHVEIVVGAKLSQKAEPPRHVHADKGVGKGRFSHAILALDRQILFVQHLGCASAALGGSILVGADPRSGPGARAAKLTAGPSD